MLSRDCDGCSQMKECGRRYFIVEKGRLRILPRRNSPPNRRPIKQAAKKRFVLFLYASFF